MTARPSRPSSASPLRRAASRRCGGWSRALPADLDAARLRRPAHPGHRPQPAGADPGPRERARRPCSPSTARRCEPGTIYVAPADHHLLVRGDRVELSRGPKENGVRPAADPMFRSLAARLGRRRGRRRALRRARRRRGRRAAVAQAGGRVIVQDPDDALVPSMPASALAVGAPHAVVPSPRWRASLAALAALPVPNPGRGGRRDRRARSRRDASSARPPRRSRSGFTCPECRGALWELREGELAALPLPRRPLLLRGRDGRRAGHARSRPRCGRRSRCSRSAASCCGGSPTRMEAQPRTEQRFRARRARGRRARRGHPPHPAQRLRAALRRERGRDERRPDGRGLRGAAGVPQAQPRRSTSPATSARACSAASGAGWRPSAASPSATTSTTSRSTPTSTSSSSRCC